MRISLYLVACVATLAGSILLPESYVSLLNYVALYAIVALGVVLLTGVAGITSFGQAAFVGIGAYASAVLSTKFAISPWVGLIVGLTLTLIAAVIIGYVTLRLSGHYLPLGTIAWGVSLYYLLGNIEEFGGHTGLSGIPAISLFGLMLDTPRRMSILIWLVLFAVMLLASNLLDSRPGRAMRSLKSGALIAESFGADTLRLQVLLFVYAACLAALSGWLYAHLLRFINPSPFGLPMGIEYLFMAVVGGAASVWGAVLGAGVVTIAKEYLQYFLPQLIGRSGNYEAIVFGALIIVLLQSNRDRGLTGLLSALVSRARRPGPAAPFIRSTTLERKDNRASETILVVDKVSKNFGGLSAISELSFEIGRGEIVGLIGPNGAGKTTLFNLLTGVIPLSSGDVEFLGKSVAGLAPRHIAARGMARTFQHVRLVPGMSVLENLMIGAYLRGSHQTIGAALRLNRSEEAAARKTADAELLRVGLSQVRDFPADELALGQQRIVEVARAACANPSLILLDEPAAGLRLGEKERLADVIRHMRAEGKAILLVEHDMEFVMELVDRLVVMNFGRKLAQGRPEEIQSDPAVLEAYLGKAAA